ncbi:MAG: hypothetical protein ABH950_02215 [Candidatus Altiarchaeota archaeon]
MRALNLISEHIQRIPKPVRKLFLEKTIPPALDAAKAGNISFHGLVEEITAAGEDANIGQCRWLYGAYLPDFLKERPFHLEERREEFLETLEGELKNPWRRILRDETETLSVEDERRLKISRQRRYDALYEKEATGDAYSRIVRSHTNISAWGEPKSGTLRRECRDEMVRASITKVLLKGIFDDRDRRLLKDVMYAPQPELISTPAAMEAQLRHKVYRNPTEEALNHLILDAAIGILGSKYYVDAMGPKEAIEAFLKRYKRSGKKGRRKERSNMDASLKRSRDETQRLFSEVRKRAVDWRKTIIAHNEFCRKQKHHHAIVTDHELQFLNNLIRNLENNPLVSKRKGPNLRDRFGELKLERRREITRLETEKADEKRPHRIEGIQHRIGFLDERMGRQDNYRYLLAQTKAF